MKPASHGNSDLKIRTKDYALSVIRLFAALPKRAETQILGRQLLGPARQSERWSPSISSLLVNCNTYIVSAVHGSRASPRTARALTANPEPVEGFFELRRESSVTVH